MKTPVQQRERPKDAAMGSGSWFSLGVGAALAMIVAPGCGSPIVGAKCADGHVSCDGKCVDVEVDQAHCGSCDNSCGNFTCERGECTTERRPRDDGGTDDGGAQPPDGSTPPDGGANGGRMDASVGRGGVGSPFLPDGGIALPDGGGPAGCGIGETICSDACVVLETDPDHCGRCGFACAADQFCIDGMCEDICDPPLSLCGRTCVDLQADWRNCGTCGRVCASGICTDGTCADIVAGHLVVIGHDYTAGASSTMQRIAGNALFLAPGTPVRALVYSGTASSASTAGVNRAIDSVVQRDGRSWMPVEVQADEVTARLATAGAFVIHAQPGATDDELRALGSDWGLSLAQFILRGGVVVLFETDSDKNAGTYQILEPANLFVADARERIATQNVTVLNPGVGVAVRTTREYRAEPVSTHFLDVMSPGNIIVEDRDGEAVVVHRVAAP